MQKAILQITFIICTNLLAFLSLGLILDALFETQGAFLLICIILSLPVLGMIMYWKAGKILHALYAISPKHDNEPNIHQ